MKELVALRLETEKIPTFIKYFSAVRLQLCVVIGSIKITPGNTKQNDADTLNLLADNITSSCNTMEGILETSEMLLGNIDRLAISNQLTGRAA